MHRWRSVPDRPARDGIVGRIYGNLGRLIGGKAAAGLVSLAYLAIAARALGPHDYGVLVLVHGFAIAVGGIVGFPGWHAVVRYGAQADAAQDPARLARLLRFAGLVEGAAGLLAVLTTALLAQMLGARMGWSPAAIAFAWPYSLAVLASVRATPAGYLQLRGRFDLLGAHNLVAPVVRLAGALLIMAAGGGLRAFLIVWLLAALAEWAAMWAMGIMVARARLHAPLRGGVRGAVRENPGIWRFMLAANADITLTELGGRVTPLVIGWMLGPVAAGLYAVAQRVTVIIAQPAQMLGQAAYAELARLVADGGRGQPVHRALLRCAGLALVTTLPVLAGIALFGRTLAVTMAGPAFAGATVVLFWLAVARALLVVGPPVSAALVALGRPGLSVIANLVAGLALLPLLPPLLAHAGLMGAGIHALLQAVTALLLLILFVRHESRASAPRPRILTA